ncbi:hypothetical protein GEMRC1_009436 [Eukaryota sp. GEM-RC1]
MSLRILTTNAGKLSGVANVSCVVKGTSSSPSGHDGPNINPQSATTSFPPTFSTSLPIWDSYIKQERDIRIKNIRLEGLLYFSLTKRIFFRGWMYVVRTHQRHVNLIKMSVAFKKRSAFKKFFSRWHISFFYKLRFHAFIGSIILYKWRYTSHRDIFLRQRFPVGVKLSNKMNLLSFWKLWLKYHSLRDQLALASTLILANDKHKVKRSSLFLGALLGVSTPEQLMWKVLLGWKSYSNRRSLIRGLVYYWYKSLMMRYLRAWKGVGRQKIGKDVFLVPMKEAMWIGIGTLNSGSFRTPESVKMVTSPMIIDVGDTGRMFYEAPLHVKYFVSLKRAIMSRFLAISGFSSLSEDDFATVSNVFTGHDFFSFLIQATVLVNQVRNKSRKIRKSHLKAVNNDFNHRVKESTIITKAVLKSSSSGIQNYVENVDDPIKSFLIDTYDRIKSADFQVEESARKLNQLNSKFSLPSVPDHLQGLFTDYLLSSLGYFKGQTPKKSKVSRESDDEEEIKPSTNVDLSSLSEFSATDWLLLQLRSLYPEEQEISNDELLVRHPHAYNVMTKMFNSSDMLPVANTRKVVKYESPQIKPLKELYYKRVDETPLD